MVVLTLALLNAVSECDTQVIYVLEVWIQTSNRCSEYLDVNVDF